jgi:pimeloyl-ACP methyl ester carboxylesterase
MTSTPTTPRLGGVKRRRVFAAVGLAWLLWRLFGREVGPRHPGPQSRPDGPATRTLLVGRHEFAVREAGPVEGPPLVLLHGWLYDGHATWHRVLPRLAATHRVYAIDLRSHGKSDRIRGRFEIAETADDVARVLDALGLGAVPIVGYSMGGMTAQELALRHPGRVTRLVLAATAAHPVPYPRRLTVPVFLIGRALGRIDHTLLPRIAHRYLLATDVIPPEHSAWLWQILLDRDTDLYYEAGFAILRFDARDRVGSIGMPTLCIIPTDDQLIPAREQYDTAARITGAVVTELVGARHEAVLSHADDIAKAIAGFVS